MNKLLKKIISLPRFIKRRHRARQNSRRLDSITDGAANANQKNPAGPRILLAPSFPIYHAQKLHDITLSAALAARGAKLTYLSAPFAHPICRGCGNITQVFDKAAVYCEFCQRFQRNEAHLVSYLRKYSDIFHPEQFITAEETNNIREQIEKLNESELHNFSLDGIQLAKFALDALRNLEYVGNEKLIPNYMEPLRKIMLVQVMYYKYFQKAVASLKPDIIVSYDAFYSPWQVLYALSQKLGIPFYNHNPGQRDSTFHYDKNRISMLLEIDELYGKWKDKKIKNSELSKIDNILARRKKGKIYKGTKIWEENEDERKKFESMLASGKPMAGLYSNVLWDLASFNRDVVFSSVDEFYRETVKFFIDHPEYNLVIKPHPDELHPTHEAREKLTEVIKAAYPNLPDNILVLRPKTSITAYDLIPKTNVSIVYTTTLGIESPIMGVPTVVLGKVHYRNKGFTYDPKNREEFFSTLENLLGSSDEKLQGKQKELARKYFYLSYFIYWHDYGVIDFDMEGKNLVVPKNLTQLLEKTDFMKVVDAIMQNKAVPYFDEGIEAND